MGKSGGDSKVGFCSLDGILSTKTDRCWWRVESENKGREREKAGERIARGCSHKTPTRGKETSKAQPRAIRGGSSFPTAFIGGLGGGVETGRQKKKKTGAGGREKGGEVVKLMWAGFDSKPVDWSMGSLLGKVALRVSQ